VSVLLCFIDIFTYPVVQSFTAKTCYLFWTNTNICTLKYISYLLHPHSSSLYSGPDSSPF